MADDIIEQEIRWKASIDGETEVERALRNLEGSTEKLSSAVDDLADEQHRARKEMDGLSLSAKGIGGGFGSAASGIGKFALQAGAALVTVQALSKGISTAFEQTSLGQDARKSFELMGLSVSEANGFVNELDEVVRDLNLDSQATFGSAKQLFSAGFNVAEIKKITRATADLQARTGQGAEEIKRIIAEAASTGKVGQEQIEAAARVSGVSFNEIFQQILNRSNKTFEEMAKDIKNTAVPPKLFTEALVASIQASEGPGADAARAATGSIRQLISGVQGEFLHLFDFSELLNNQQNQDAVKEFFGGISKAIRDIKPVVEDVFGFIFQGIRRAGRSPDALNEAGLKALKDIQEQRRKDLNRVSNRFILQSSDDELFKAFPALKDNLIVGDNLNYLRAYPGALVAALQSAVNEKYDSRIDDVYDNQNFRRSIAAAVAAAEEQANGIDYRSRLKSTSATTKKTKENEAISRAIKQYRTAVDILGADLTTQRLGSQQDYVDRKLAELKRQGLPSEIQREIDEGLKNLIEQRRKNARGITGLLKTDEEKILDLLNDERTKALLKENPNTLLKVRRLADDDIGFQQLKAGLVERNGELFYEGGPGTGIQRGNNRSPQLGGSSLTINNNISIPEGAQNDPGFIRQVIMDAMKQSLQNKELETRYGY